MNPIRRAAASRKDRSDLVIRPARRADGLRLANLCTQLGYPSTPDELAVRLPEILKRPDHAVFVAEANGEVKGWVHVYLSLLLESDHTAEIGGLVVDEAARSLGIGKALMGRAEAWAYQRGCRELRLRSNLVRKEAHRFYEALGYENLKTSFTFRKRL